MANLGQDLGRLAFGSCPASSSLPRGTSDAEELCEKANRMGAFTVWGDHRAVLTSPDGVLWSVGSCSDTREAPAMAEGAGKHKPTEPRW